MQTKYTVCRMTAIIVFTFLFAIVQNPAPEQVQAAELEAALSALEVSIGAAQHAADAPLHANSSDKCGESMTAWHPAAIRGCATGHEHGDPPPRWIYRSGYRPSFAHSANTPGENDTKHTSFKGFLLRDDGVDVYIIAHLDANPRGHHSRFHSYQVWARDKAGKVSHWQGWMDFGEGDMTGPQTRKAGCEDTSVRPIMAVFTRQCSADPIRFEAWYSRAGGNGGWSWDFGFNMKATYFSEGDPDTPATWIATGDLNDRRRAELAWYDFRDPIRGRFWATQWGDIVSGPKDLVCGTTRQFGEKTYTVLCLRQYIAPTMTTVKFPDNAVEIDYDLSSVSLPN